MSTTTSPPNAPSTPPLMTLHPIADAHERWVAVLLQTDSTTLDELATLLADLGVFEALGTLPCVLPQMPVDALTADLGKRLPVAQVILRLPLAQCTDPAHGDAIEALRASGFRLMTDGLPEAIPLAAGVTSLGLDFSADQTVAKLATPSSLTTLQALSGPHLALGLDDPAQLKPTQALGFSWIAGNYPLHVAHVSPATANPGRAIMLKLLGQIVSDADSKDIEKTLKQDPQLSYQLLKLVNSVAFSLSKEINSFGQAISLLGRRQLQRWLQLLLYARPHNEKGQASPLMPRAALRAGLMENLAALAGCSKDLQDQAFMVGMFSLLEPMFGQASADVIKPLHLAPEVSSALIDKQGRLGLWLAAIEASERGPSPQARTALAAAGVGLTAWIKAQVAATQWAIQVSREA